MCVCFFLTFCVSTDPPRINSSDVVTEVSVIVNHALELRCEASGIPTPTLTWLKDGRPLTDGLRVPQGGRVLHVASAQVSAQSDGINSCFITSCVSERHVYAVFHPVGGHGQIQLLGQQPSRRRGQAVPGSSAR